MKNDLSELALFIAQSISDQPSLVRVNKRGSLISLRVGAGEEGKLIGRQGRVIQAIRTIVRSAADPQERITVDIDAPKKS